MIAYNKILISIISCLILFSSGYTLPQNKTSDNQSQFGYTIHFNALKSVGDAKKSITFAQTAGAGVVNIVPPAHIWLQPADVEMLDTLFAEASAKNIRVILSRIDANYPDGKNYLYGKVLAPVVQSGAVKVYPIVGNLAYEDWMQQETEYYATHYGQHPNLAGICLGGFAEIFDSPRAGVLVWSDKTKRYEIGQYTDLMKKYWQQWLVNQFENIDRINQEYKTNFASIEDIPMPNSESDKKFGLPHRAYFDFVTAINSWWWKQYNHNRKLWQKSSKTPFILQLNGTLIDKLGNGHPAFAALNLPAWLNNADAIGLSLYTDSKLADLGFGSLYGTANLVQWAKELGKPIFILESGMNRPKSGFDLFHLRYLTQLAIPLNPNAYIYEHFRYGRQEKIIPAGYLYTVDWKPNLPNSGSIQRAFQQTNRIVIENRSKSVAPYLYVITMPKLVRDDAVAARFNMMLYPLSTFVPIRMVDINDIAFIPAKQMVLLAPTWKSELPDIYQMNILQLAKRRSWMLMADEHTYPQIQRQLGKDIAGATLDLAGYMTEVKSDVVAIGFGKALVNFYLGQYKAAPNGIVPEPGLVYLPLSNGIKVFCLQPIESVSIDAAPWNLNEKDKTEFQVTVYRYDTQPTAVRIAMPVIPRGTVKTIRWNVTESIGNKRVPVPAKMVKNNFEFLAKSGTEYSIINARLSTK
jgi:hypothetical protein